MKIAVPAYFENKKDFEILLLSENVSMTVINPCNGPGEKRNEEYNSIIKKLRDRGIEAFGYVHTSRASRHLSEVFSDIGKYISWYDLDGIFLDEVSPKYKWEYYYRISKTLDEMGRKLIINPGDVPDEDYIHISHVILSFENTFDIYKKSKLRDWPNKYPSEKFWHILHTTNERDLNETLSLVKQRNAGFVYVTDCQEPNAYFRLPSYWKREVDLISRDG